MKKSQFLAGLIAGCLFTVVCALAVGFLRTQPVEAQTRVKWEYKVVGDDLRSANIGEVNAAGSQGWEAVSMSGPQVLFKRRK